MISRAQKYQMIKSGMTLAEVMIAIAVIAFSIPLILAAQASAHHSRQAAEADSHSGWLVRDVQRRIISAWSDHTQSSGLEVPFHFPTANSPKALMRLSYNSNRTLIKNEDNDQAVYLVSVKAEPYIGISNSSSSTLLAMISIDIKHPAKSNKKSNFLYHYVSTREGIL